MKAKFISRIAPTPSGYLHAGNVYNFLLTYLFTRALGGVLHLRIDDYDLVRYRREFVENIFAVLEMLGIECDEGASGTAEFESKFSSKFRLEGYQTALKSLQERALCYACDCSHSMKQNFDDGIYLQLCLHKNLAYQRDKTCIRLHVPAPSFVPIRGLIFRQNLAQCDELNLVGKSFGDDDGLAKADGLKFGANTSKPSRGAGSGVLNLGLKTSGLKCDCKLNTQNLALNPAKPNFTQNQTLNLAQKNFGGNNGSDTTDGLNLSANVNVATQNLQAFLNSEHAISANTDNSGHGGLKSEQSTDVSDSSRRVESGTLNLSFKADGLKFKLNKQNLVQGSTKNNQNLAKPNSSEYQTQNLAQSTAKNEQNFDTDVKYGDKKDTLNFSLEANGLKFSSKLHKPNLGLKTSGLKRDCELSKQNLVLNPAKPNFTQNQTLNLARSLGDFAIWKKDDTPSYNLASLVDDANLGVNLLVRGGDLLECSAAQIYMASILNLDFKDAKFIHHPLILQDGKKLSKSSKSSPVNLKDGAKIHYKFAALNLGLDPQKCETLSELLENFKDKFSPLLAL